MSSSLDSFGCQVGKPMRNDTHLDKTADELVYKKCSHQQNVQNEVVAPLIDMMECLEVL